MNGPNQKNLCTRLLHLLRNRHTSRQSRESLVCGGPAAETVPARQYLAACPVMPRLRVRTHVPARDQIPARPLFVNRLLCKAEFLFHPLLLLLFHFRFLHPNFLFFFFLLTIFFLACSRDPYAFVVVDGGTELFGGTLSQRWHLDSTYT